MNKFTNEKGEEVRKPVSHTFTDKDGEFVFGPLCPDKSYEIQVWVDRVKHVKICKECKRQGKCLKGVKLECEDIYSKKDLGDNDRIIVCKLKFGLFTIKLSAAIIYKDNSLKNSTFSLFILDFMVTIGSIIFISFSSSCSLSNSFFFFFIKFYNTSFHRYKNNFTYSKFCCFLKN